MILVTVTLHNDLLQTEVWLLTSCWLLQFANMTLRLCSQVRGQYGDFFFLSYCTVLDASFYKVTAKVKNIASMLGHNETEFKGCLCLTSWYFNADIHEAYFPFFYYVQFNFFRNFCTCCLYLIFCFILVASCYGLNVCVYTPPPSLYSEALLPNVIVFGDKAFGRLLGLYLFMKVGLYDQIIALIKKKKGRDMTNMATTYNRKRGLARYRICQDLDLRLPVSKTEK